MAEQSHSGGIAEHLQYWSYSFDDSNPFMQIHLDTMLLTLFIATGMIVFALWLRGKLVAGTPTGVQNFMESVIDFINQTVKDNFPVYNPLVAPLAMTIFVFILLCNSLDILPAYLMHHVAGAFGLHTFRQVPTNDLNLPAAMAVSVFLLVLYYEFKLKPGHFVKELLLQPFASLLLDSKNPVVKLIGVLLIPLNLTLKLIEELAKPLSLSFRLFGNMFAGEVIFLLIASLLLSDSFSDIASAGGIVSEGMGLLVGLGWSLFHMFIGLLQAFIFMILSVVYLSIAHQPAEH
ncbi:F0F1 ATP synthase subunit A [Mariprofundus erugo]|uniref:ATP synthase subunit a n=1 Tax=Mariprofundus erugo TaxID=2528639 RepID=A0A5R9GQK7_9PROT|nr:F0F1 ATP synthase subunit A [Mariprofundus erugo]TLS68210.1 F0F1 ATP synthase subunit A [Mariprofundus erugo]